VPYARNLTHKNAPLLLACTSLMLPAALAVLKAVHRAHAKTRRKRGCRAATTAPYRARSCLNYIELAPTWLLAVYCVASHRATPF
jgi:hypothetical protein